MSNLFSSHPPTEVRVEALLRLEQQQNSPQRVF